MILSDILTLLGALSLGGLVALFGLQLHRYLAAMLAPPRDDYPESQDDFHAAMQRRIERDRRMKQ